MHTALEHSRPGHATMSAIALPILYCAVLPHPEYLSEGLPPQVLTPTQLLVLLVSMMRCMRDHLAPAWITHVHFENHSNAALGDTVVASREGVRRKLPTV